MEKRGEDFLFPGKGGVCYADLIAMTTAALPPLPPPEFLELLGVPYDHYRLADGADLYVTAFGRPFVQQLRPESWFAPDWFKSAREKLCGTSRVYRVETRPAPGVPPKALVVKWCRVGEEVPMDTFTLNKFIEAEFNSPYEEFSLLLEMRSEGRTVPIRTHKPLAIYVPAKRFELWQTGRSQSKMARKKAKFRDVELDIYRQYILIYEWIKGVAATSPEAIAAAAADSRVPATPTFPDQMLQRSVADMWQAGFRVLDVKPQHVIVRPLAKPEAHGQATSSGADANSQGLPGTPGVPEGASAGLLRDRAGAIAYALVDFELLARTPAREAEVLATRRQNYLQRQRDRFAPPPSTVPFPPHLHSQTIWGVDYIHGDCSSTNGKLWVVGHDPALFDYFQPERWRRTPRESLSDTARVYRTTTKDNIQLVWKVAHVGDIPDPDDPLAFYGYNSPFEEVAFALRLSEAGVPTTYPRAIYMLGHLSTLPPDSLDPRRYASHAHLRMPDGSPILQKTRNYIAIWGYWNGLDEDLARAGRHPYCSGINARNALAQGRITPAEAAHLDHKTARLLASGGFRDLRPSPTHYLLTLLPDGTLLRDPDATPAVRICTFETLAPLA